MYSTSKMKKIWRKFVIWLKGTNQMSMPSPFWLAVYGLSVLVDDVMSKSDLTNDSASKKDILQYLLYIINNRQLQMEKGILTHAITIVVSSAPHGANFRILDKILMKKKIS